MRITTQGTLNSYKSGLMNSANQLSYARNKVLTQRNFNSYAENPAAATQAFKLRRMLSQTADQLNNNSALSSKFDSAYTSISKVKTLLQDAAKDIALRGGTDSTASGREPLGAALSGVADSIVQTLNSQYSDAFVFAGNNPDKAPFSWGPNGDLMFQGLSVNAGLPGAPDGTPPHPDSVTAGSDWDTYYTNNPDFATLAKMSNESQYIDIGSGLNNNSNGSFNTASAFDSAISGIDIIGFGVDADGDPKNAVSLIKQLSEIYKRCDSTSGEYANEQDKNNADRLTKKLDKSLSEVTNKWTDLDGQAGFLKTNKDLLTTNADTLKEQILGLEQADLADAITDFSWAQYCYNSALKVGNSILSQSLIDYMN